jgi:ribosomal protein S24E
MFSADPSTKLLIARYILNIIPVVPVCFPKGTPVQTDQGIINIDKIDTKKHTIWNNKIVAITKSIPMQKHIICIEKHSLDKNVPLKDTYISMNHKLMYNNKMIEAKELVGKVEGIYTKKYNNEILYNILLEKHDVMIVNNLICETLYPGNGIAKIYKYLQSLNPIEQEYMIKKHNEYMSKRTFFNSKKSCKSNTYKML